MTEKQQQIYNYLEDLQKLTSEIPAELQQRIPNELLSELATCVIEGPVFEIVQGLKDVQNAEEKQLFKERLGVLRSHSNQKLDFQTKYQNILLGDFEPSEVVKLQEDLDSERRTMEKTQIKDLSEFDKKIILKIDQHVKDQQLTLERAGVPGMYYTDDPVMINVQRHLLTCILKLGSRS